MTEYIVLCGQVVGGGDRPFDVLYSFDGRKFPTRDLAIKHGLKVRGSDDFNIGVINRGKLVSLDWMEKMVDADPSILAAINEQVGLRAWTA